MVLTDQLKVRNEFTRIVAKSKGALIHDTENDVPSYTQNKVLESHLYRIEKMDKLAEKTYQAVRILWMPPTLF